MDNEQRGLGKVVYGAETHAEHESDASLAAGGDVVEEASEESFPASDPPVYSRGSATGVGGAEDVRGASA